MSILPKKDQEKLISEALDPKKVTLTCGLHHYAYGGKLKPNFKCKRCMFTMFLGLIANTPPDQRQDRAEELEMLIHRMIECKDEVQYQEFFKHPEVYVNDKRVGTEKVN